MIDEYQEPTKSIPASLESERSVLGSILIDPEAILEVSEILKPEDFFRMRHGWIYAAMLAISDRNEGIDFITLADELERRGQLEEVGGPAAITDMIGSTPTSMNVLTYAKQVASYARRRRLIEALGKSAEMAYDLTIDDDELFPKVDQMISDVTADPDRENDRELGEVMVDLVDKYDDIARNGLPTDVVPTGYTQVDRLTGGFRKGQLIVGGARPAMGKSALATDIARNAARRYNKRTAIFSLEMPDTQIGERILAAETGIDSARLRTGQIAEDEWPLLMEAANVASRYRITINDSSIVTYRDIRRGIKRMKKRGPLDLVIVDHLHLMTSLNPRRNNTTTDDLSEISRNLKIIAREEEVPILALAQLSRKVEERADKRPNLADLRGSGGLEQDADIVFFMYREDYYEEESERQNLVDLIFAKHREGSNRHRNALLPQGIEPVPGSRNPAHRVGILTHHDTTRSSFTRANISIQPRRSLHGPYGPIRHLRTRPNQRRIPAAHGNRARRRSHHVSHIGHPHVRRRNQHQQIRKERIMSAVTLAPVTPTADANTIQDTLAEAAQSLAASLQNSRGLSDIKIEAEHGYRLWGIRMGHAASVIATRYGETEIGATDLDLIAGEMKIPAAATWRQERWTGKRGMSVQAAICVYEIAN